MTRFPEDFREAAWRLKRRERRSGGVDGRRRKAGETAPTPRDSCCETINFSWAISPGFAPCGSNRSFRSVSWTFVERGVAGSNKTAQAPPFGSPSRMRGEAAAAMAGRWLIAHVAEDTARSRHPQSESRADPAKPPQPQLALIAVADLVGSTRTENQPTARRAIALRRRAIRTNDANSAGSRFSSRYSFSFACARRMSSG